MQYFLFFFFQQQNKSVLCFVFVCVSSDEVMQLRKERDELAEETERLKAKHKKQQDRVEQQHR